MNWTIARITRPASGAGGCGSTPCDVASADTSVITPSRRPGGRARPATLPSPGGTAGTTRRARARSLVTLRLVREGPFAAPVGYPEPDDHGRIEMRSPADVYAFMAPYAAREVGESFWILALDAQHRVSAPTVITRGILNASLVPAGGLPGRHRRARRCGHPRPQPPEQYVKKQRGREL
jgi:hypothetical protein